MRPRRAFGLVSVIGTHTAQLHNLDISSKSTWRTDQEVEPTRTNKKGLKIIPWKRILTGVMPLSRTHFWLQ
jgi:hypothetical protein